MLTLIKECAPKIEKFLQITQSFLNQFLSFSQNQTAAVFSFPSVEREGAFSGGRDFPSAQPPRYPALSILRV